MTMATVMGMGTVTDDLGDNQHGGQALATTL
jgi:hypothetical protein